MEEQWSFGILLRKYREERGLEPKELAYAAGCSGDYIRRMERGQRKLTIAQLQRLIRALELDDMEAVELLLAAMRP